MSVVSVSVGQVVELGFFSGSGLGVGMALKGGFVDPQCESKVCIS